MIGDAIDAASGEKLVMSFDKLPDNMEQDNASVELCKCEGRDALRVNYARAEWPKVNFVAPDGGWDWSDYAGVAVDVYNPSDTPVIVAIRIDNPGADGAHACNARTETIPPGEWTRFETYFPNNDRDVFWGMRGLPMRSAECNTRTVLDLKHITAFQLFLPLPEKGATLYFDRVRLFGENQPLEQLVKMPFVDKYGQFKHADWPGKLASDTEFAERRRIEEADLAANPTMPGRDSYGGWADGPRLEATGWFRTENVDGKWWLVTPQGNLFFSTGINVVGIWERTFIEKREKWFEWLPEAGGEFGAIYGRESRNWPNMKIVDGRTFSFYCANLVRKYGSDWQNQWRKTTRARMRSWGFNTLTTWADEELRRNSGIPFTWSVDTRRGFKRVGDTGLVDPFAPEFASEIDKCVKEQTAEFAGNPLCIGFFVNNEMPWEGALGHRILAAPADTPARQALVEWLKSKYRTIGDLNQAWEIDAGDWADLAGPTAAAASQRDCDEFTYTFARRYFDTVHASLRKYAPHHLDLGCRFSMVNDTILRACADVVDVVSLNLYQSTISDDRWTGERDLGKPVITGEFHFGALDRGMFHPGLVRARDQQGRAQCYRQYVRSLADCPAFVGFAWFQYADEPLTGRDGDAENYNIGLVDVTDTPYPELHQAIMEANSEVYRRHAGSD